MKTYILISLLVLSNYCFSQTNPSIVWPTNYSVFQRNGNTISSTSSVTFAGQVYNKTNAKYQIEKLDQFGSFKSTYIANSLITGISGVITQNVGTSAMTFYFTLTIPTGWYRLTITDGSNRTTTTKFGIGEVFVIAGQSNAQGEGSTQNIGNELQYDCVVSCKSDFSFSSYSYIQRPIMGTVHSNGKIGPLGFRAWFYQELGNKIASSSSSPTTSSLTNVVPVAFFNSAIAGSSIDNWKTALDRTRFLYNNNYSNPLTTTSGQNHFNPWGFSYDDRDPYMALQFTLSYYANLFGIRSVLWHQGESETKMELSKNNYGKYQLVKNNATPCSTNPNATDYIQDFNFYNNYSLSNYSSKLNSIIQDTRSILPNLQWAISKVSLTSEYKYITDGNGNVISDINCSKTNFLQQNITNPAVISQQVSVYSPLSKINWVSENSDSFTAPTYRSDGTHFNSSGLSAMATEFYNYMSTIMSVASIPPRSVSRLSFTKSGSTYTVTCNNPNSPVYYQWLPADPTFWGDFQSFSSTNTQTKVYYSNSGVNSWSCYTKDASGRIALSHFVFLGVSGARIAQNGLEEDIVYPNPSISNQEITFNIKIEESTPLKILISDENGKEIDKIEDEINDKGEYKYHLSLPIFEKGQKVLYVTILKNNLKEVKRIIVNN